MKNTLYLFLTTLLLFSCVNTEEPWEKDPLNVDVEFVIESDQKRGSIINTHITDGSIGTIDVSVKEIESENLPFKKIFPSQKINFYTIASLSLKDRSPVVFGEPFSEYTITLKIFVDNELKKEKTFLVKNERDIQYIDYAFEELFFD